MLTWWLDMPEFNEIQITPTLQGTRYLLPRRDLGGFKWVGRLMWIYGVICVLAAVSMVAVALAKEQSSAAILKEVFKPWAPRLLA